MYQSKKIYNVLLITAFSFFVPLLIAVITRENETAWMVHFFNGNRTTFWDYFFKYTTDLGHGICLIPVLLLVFYYKKEFWPVVIVASALHGILVPLFKKVIFAGSTFSMRPAALHGAESFNQILDIPFHYHHSLPSGHTTTAFVIGGIIMLLLPNWKGITLGLLYGIVVAISRMYLVQHFFIDVAAGGILGLSSVLVAWMLCLRFDLIHYIPWKKRQNAGDIIQTM
ncbi:phosphatase PAP2 family protein [Flammeovirga sp. SJP92]|uniref:phosphatase PAP2 family protein n=1 Tax=Flammeovirga sp. SJP92 TaxID=1775430 RepID=UPI000789097E|nr:phosphatase PAP2 family protein [Flammeovirga sp. SJP92]KXX67184.1 hypothetical protein AVL50_27740 [Flammeovirga sp. SJP92]